MKLHYNNRKNFPKKILIVVRWPVGGIRTFMRYVYRNFEPSHYFFTIVAPKFDELEELMVDLANIDAEFVPIKNMPTDGSSGYLVMCRVLFSQFFTKKYDMVHSHGFTSALCASIPAFIFRIPHLITSHDVFNQNQFLGFKGYLKRVGIGVLFSLANCIHCVSLDARKNLLTNIPLLKKYQNKIVAIPNGLETSRFLVEEKEDFYKFEGVEKSDFLIGFFGRFMAQKGFRYLVEAIEILRKQSLPRTPKVLCFGWGGFIREEQEALKQKGVSDYFLFLPFRSNIALALRGVDLVVMPSLWEAYGLLAAETLVAGTPLIGTNCEGLREVLQDTPAQIVPPRDASALAEAILKQMVNPTKLESSDYRCIAASRFDVSNQVNGLKEIIENFC